MADISFDDLIPKGAPPAGAQSAGISFDDLIPNPAAQEASTTPTDNTSSIAQGVGKALGRAAFNVPAKLVEGAGAIGAAAGTVVGAASSNYQAGVKSQLGTFDQIDAGKPVNAMDDPLGYGDASPDQRAQIRKDTQSEVDAMPAPQDTGLGQLGAAITSGGQAVMGAGKSVEKAGIDAVPMTAEEQARFSVKAVGILSSAVPYVLAGIAGGPGGVAAVAGTEGFGDTYQAAKDAGMSDADAAKAAAFGGVTSAALTAIPMGQVARVAKAIPDALKGAFLAGVGKLATASGTGVAFSQINELANNLIAQQSYDPDRATAQGLGQDLGPQALAFAMLPGVHAGIEAGAGVAVRNAQAIAEIGKAPDVDTAIKAAADAVTRPADATITVRPDPVDIAGSTDAVPTNDAALDRASRIQAERDRISAMRVPANDVAADTTGTGAGDVGTTVEAAAAPPTDAPASAADETTANAQTASVTSDAADPVPASVGAAATADLDPGLGDLTPKQEAAYRATAEGQKLLESQPYGVEDNTEYLPGAVHNAAEAAQTVEAARELKTLKQMNPDVAEAAANVAAENADVQQIHFQQRAGSPIDLQNAEEARSQQMQQDTDAAWSNKSEAAIAPVMGVIQEILDSRDGRRPLVRSVVESVRKQLFDAQGQPITDPEILYGVGDHINDLLSENDPGGVPKYKRAQATLMQIKDALYNDVIEPAAPGFKQALDNYAQSSTKIDEMKALQQFEPKLFDAGNKMTYQKVQTMMRQIVDSRQAPGLNVFKSISQDTMNSLWDLRDHLRRTAAADKLGSTVGGSDTAQNLLDQARMRGEAQAGDSANAMELARAKQKANIVRQGASFVPYVGKALQRVDAVTKPIREAEERSARDKALADQKIADAQEQMRLSQERSARGLAMLRPDRAPTPRQDVAPRPADFVPNPVQARAPIDLLNPTGNGLPPAVEQAAPAPSAATLGPPPTASPNSLYASTVAKTPDGRAVPVRYVVKEASGLVPSQLADGRINEAYPAELQPRDRTRDASVDQVGRMANTLDPTRLAYAADTSTGAPVVGADGFVESGNGRMMAIQQAYAKNGVPAAQYRAFLAQQGFDVSGMKNPVLVRERVGDMTMDDRAKLAGEMGKSAILEMSAPEKAAADAKLITPDMLSLVKRGGLAGSTNGAFAKAFADKAMSGSERGGFMADDGAMSRDGEARVRNALAQRAYDNNDIVSKMAEDIDPDMKAFGGALMDASPMMAKLRGAIESGAVPKSSDLSPALMEAANLVKRARQNKTSIATEVAQTDAFSQRLPQTDEILRSVFGDDLSSRMSRQRFGNLLNNYADAMQNEYSMFGNSRPASVVFKDEAAKLRPDTESTQSRFLK